MKKIYCKILFALIFVLTIFSAHSAEKVAFEANAPMIVAVGEAFRVEFSLNSSPDDGSFNAPDFTGFDIQAGPAESTGRSVQIINGSMSNSVSYTITYVLMAQKAGNYTIGRAAITTGGTVYRTRSLPIEVVADGEAQSTQRSRPSQEQGGGGESAGQGQISKDDILLRINVSRTSVFKGEPLRATIKLYQRVPIVGIEDYKASTFNGFWAQELNADAATSRETYNGRVYETQVVKDYLLYPQQSGTLTIEPTELTAIAQTIVQSRRNADPFFGGGHEVYNVRRKIHTPKVVISVKNLPSGAPASFNGAVGRFTMDASIPSTQIAANSAATYTVRISGTGNMSFVQAPKLTLPTSFEQYNVKTTESINSSASGTSGYKQFEYPFIARAEGSYDIAPLEFSFFNPSTMQYVTLRSQPFTLSVSPDVNGGSDTSYVVKGLSKEDVKMLGQDIRFIKIGNASLSRDRSPFLFSASYLALLAAILLIFGTIYIALRKRIRDSKNVALIRGKRANKVAVQRFRAAKQYMLAKEQHSFYEEMLRAMWGYMSDRFNIPVANLTKENVREELHKRGVSHDESHRFAAIITKCDEAQYSPMASAQMSDVYTDGVDFVSRIETIIKR